MILIWPLAPSSLKTKTPSQDSSATILQQVFYWIQLREGSSFSQKKQEVALRLLKCKLPEKAEPEFSESTIGWVIPRRGLISPWSSKATEILHRAGLKEVLRVERSVLYSSSDRSQVSTEKLFDVMMEVLVTSTEEAREVMFGALEKNAALSFRSFSLEEMSLEQWNQREGWSLSEKALRWLEEYYSSREFPATEPEIRMFAEVNSEHCRHRIFRSPWALKTASGQKHNLESLFSLIKKTTTHCPKGVLSAYHDNAAVLAGHPLKAHFLCDPSSGTWYEKKAQRDVVLKVETHNHPTAISPYPGAATGVGGEIRDEVATGLGASTVGGMCGYVVSNLKIPEYNMPWERENPSLVSDHPFISSALKIMLEAPLGASDYANEYGRALITGFFRTLEHKDDRDQKENTHFWRGYHKPLMICGGVGSINREAVHKRSASAGNLLIALGGPAMKIGLGGGSVSSQAGGSSIEKEFASVQRDNAEMQRRVFGVIEAINLIAPQAIISIHDVGAGGWANALPELVHDAQKGAKISLRDLPIADQSMDSFEIWCNEAQERYVLCLSSEYLPLWQRLCDKERAPYAVIGQVTEEPILEVFDQQIPIHGPQPVNLPLKQLFDFKEGTLEVEEVPAHLDSSDESFLDLNFSEIIERVFRRPEVADKSFLITIADRSVGGLTYQDPMIGPWQVPVADGGVVLSSFNSLKGQVMAVGERPLVALKNPAAASRLAAAEAVMNALSADVMSLDDIRFSANWQLDFSHPPDQQGLYQAVKALSSWCLDLGIAIPVGKDSMSMSVAWQDHHKQHYRVSSPISLVITAVASVENVQKTLTPQWKKQSSHLIWISLTEGEFRSGGSSLSQAFNSLGGPTPDLPSQMMKNFFQALRKLKDEGHLLAYHDISDGGMLVCLAEMAFASHRAIKISLDQVPTSPIKALFSEEIGALMQIKETSLERARQIFADHGISCYHLSSPGEWCSKRIAQDHNLEVSKEGKVLLSYDLFELKKIWSSLSYHMKRLRDGEEVALEELRTVTDPHNRGLFCEGPGDDDFKVIESSHVSAQSRPKVAILREQGVNGHREMAFCFHHAGFEACDVTMSQLLKEEVSLNSFQGFVACGGFSFGDVLGAGAGWAGVIREHEHLRRHMRAFLNDAKTFALGVCNGAQMLTHLKDWIPGGEHWPELVKNRSQRFESRVVMVEVTPSPSVFWNKMSGWKLPVIVAHSEGRAVYKKNLSQTPSLVGLRYIDSQGQPTQHYPANPATSEFAVAGFTSKDGRISVAMPHPERCYLKANYPWDSSFKDTSPWQMMFLAAREFAEKQIK